MTQSTQLGLIEAPKCRASGTHTLLHKRTCHKFRNKRMFYPCDLYISRANAMQVMQACGAPVHAAASAGRAETAAALRARRNQHYIFNRDIQTGYSALLMQLETRIMQKTFEDMNVAKQTVTDLDIIRQNLQNLSDEETLKFVRLDQEYVEAAITHLKDLYRSFILADVQQSKQYFYQKYQTFFNVLFLVLFEVKLSDCVILLEKMQKILRLQVQYKLEEYTMTVNNMLKEVRDDRFTPSNSFATRIKYLDPSRDSETKFQTLMTSVNLDVMIQRIKKLRWEDLLRTYESHKDIFELRQFEKTICDMRAAMEEPGFIPSDKFGGKIKSLKKDLDREIPREDNLVGQDLKLRILNQKRNLWEQLNEKYQKYQARLNVLESKKLQNGLESEINEPGSTGPASLPHATQVPTHANPMRAGFAPAPATSRAVVSPPAASGQGGAATQTSDHASANVLNKYVLLFFAKPSTDKQTPAYRAGTGHGEAPRSSLAPVQIHTPADENVPVQEEEETVPIAHILSQTTGLVVGDRSYTVEKWLHLFCDCFDWFLKGYNDKGGEEKEPLDWNATDHAAGLGSFHATGSHASFKQVCEGDAQKLPTLRARKTAKLSRVELCYTLKPDKTLRTLGMTASEISALKDASSPPCNYLLIPLMQYQYLYSNNLLAQVMFNKKDSPATSGWAFKSKEDRLHFFHGQKMDLLFQDSDWYKACGGWGGLSLKHTERTSVQQKVETDADGKGRNTIADVTTVKGALVTPDQADALNVTTEYSNEPLFTGLAFACGIEL